jgi:DNA repair exonuclease SbcCD nuclease subunit
MDYWALGHIHNYRVLSSGDCCAVYAGALQGRSLKPSERGAKGAVIATIEGGAVTGCRFAPLPHVRFVEIAVDVAATADIGRLVARLDQEVDAELASGTATGLIARARLTGCGAVYQDLQAADAVDELLQRMREEANGREPFLWWSGFRNETRPEIDRNAIRARGDFSGELVRLVDTLREDDTRLTNFVDAKTGDLWTSSLQRASGKLDADLGSVVEEAEMLALGKLESRSSQ